MVVAVVLLSLEPNDQIENGRVHVSLAYCFMTFWKCKWIFYVYYLLANILWETCQQTAICYLADVCVLHTQHWLHPWKSKPKLYDSFPYIQQTKVTFLHFLNSTKNHSASSFQRNLILFVTHFFFCFASMCLAIMCGIDCHKP